MLFRSYLLDALDPGLFGTEEAPWLPAPQLRVNNVPARLVATAEAAWAALHPELTERLKRADGFLRQRSIYSAREEIRAGLTALSRKLDQLANTENESSGSQRKLAIRKSMPHESSLQHAFRALDECGFVPQEEIGENLQTFVDLIPRATLNHPWASDLVYALGKTYEHEYEQDPKRAEVIRKQALECFVVASRIAPRRGALANQLGYSYLQAGMTEEAFKALRQSLDAGPTATTWRNLAELYRRQGATREARLADEQAEYLLKME